MKTLLVPASNAPTELPTNTSETKLSVQPNSAWSVNQLALGVADLQNLASRLCRKARNKLTW